MFFCKIKEQYEKTIAAGLILNMIFLCTTTFGQTNELRPEKVKEDKIAEKTYLNVLLKTVNTNLYYGKSNIDLADK